MEKKKEKTSKSTGVDSRNEFNKRQVIDAALEDIRSVGVAKEGLEKLTSAGCDLNALLINLFYHCGHIHTKKGQRIDVGLKKALEFSRDVGKLAIRLKEDADKLDRIIIGLRDHAQWDLHTQSLPGQMRDVAGILDAFHQNLKKGRPAISGRNKHLYYVSELISAVMGDPHYKELAEIIAVMQSKDKETPTPKPAEPEPNRYRL